MEVTLDLDFDEALSLDRRGSGAGDRESASGDAGIHP